ncbi:dual oxidase 2-like [Atheta coriaria]|uniref:dual oxidase 2-like n=1 Tax=Dalotia coriaria TaxID=877792 RepID=UPI0031F34C20
MLRRTHWVFVLYGTIFVLITPNLCQNDTKPPHSDYGARQASRKRFGEWLLGKHFLRKVEYPGYDGWYNNLARPDSGAIDRPLLRRSPAAYADGTYAPAGGNRPNPFDLSDQLLNGTIGSRSNTGKTAFLVFFGQQIVEEILDAQRPACPPEYFNIPIPKEHPYRKQHSHTEMPLLRTRFDHRTGHSPNNPRQQLNEITPYLDGGLIYGITKQWADQLRTYANGTIDPNGKLATTPGGLFPEYNTHRLPMANPPPPFHHAKFIKNHEILPVTRFFKLGNPRGNENTFLLTFGVLWFRWHNFLAEQIKLRQPHLSSEAVFNEARKWVIATQQHIVIDEWLPAWLSKPLEKYKTYDASIDPQIDQYFQTAAFRFGHTLVTPGVYVRDYNRNECGFNAIRILGTKAVRTCNAFWRPQTALTSKVNSTTGEIVDIDRLLMGMASQLCEKEDHEIVEDLRGNVFGPLEFPRRDLMAINVQRGRDHGLPDFNTARRAYGLKPYTSFDDFKTITPEVKERLRLLYRNNIDNVDTWIGGILETTSTGPGELFETIILDQFRRIRNADRFWYENLENRLFTAAEVKRIKQISVYDIVMLVTKMDALDIQENVFRVPSDDSKIGEKCKKVFVKSSSSGCQNCSHLPILNAAQLNEPCVQGTTFDYFSGSETSFILTFTGVATFIVSALTLAYVLMQWRVRTVRMASPTPTNGQIYDAKEITGPRSPSRIVFVTFDESKKQILVMDPKETLLRAVDCSNGITYMCTIDKPALVIKVLHGYDLVLMFKYAPLRANFVQSLTLFAAKIQSAVHEHEAKLLYKIAAKKVITKQQRQAEVERFFRVVFGQAFVKSYESQEKNMVDDTSLSLVETELTRYEFAEALSMDPKSAIAMSMFDLVDKDKNNFVSFREFIDFIATFAEGTAKDKAKLLFKMYNINDEGKLPIETFKQLTGSFLGRSLSEVNEVTLNNSIDELLRSKNLHGKTALTFDDFLSIINEDYDTLNNVKVNLTIGKKKYNTAQQMVDEVYADVRRFGAKRQEETKLLNDAVINEETMSSRWNFLRYVERKSKEIFWVTLYTLVMIAIFAERAYYYSVEREVGGLRQIAGYGVSITRGAASAMMFTYASLLVTMCRNIITILRDTSASTYFPFDFCVDFHKYIAFWALGFTLLHIIGHSLNFYHISTQTADDLTCLFRNFFHATHEFPKFHYWCWGTITGVTGILLTLILAIMMIFAQTWLRRRLYNYFWYTHSLYPIYYILMVLHGTGQLVQPPIFYYFFLGPVILFSIDQCISISRKKTEIIVEDVKILPSNVTMLKIAKPHGFTYKAGQWIRVACLGINAHEYHPFTLSSSPNQNYISIHVRAVGPWTNALRQIYSDAQLYDRPFSKLYIDGPFGEGHQDWNKYDVSVLIASGIGVTPFASILKDIVYKSNSEQFIGKKVYFLWVSRSQKQFEWLVDLLREIEEQDKHDVINPHIYITEFYEKYDLRTTLLYIFEKHYQKLNNKSMFTNLQAVTHFGRPNVPQFLNTVLTLHSQVEKVGVFSCGNPKINLEVAASCNKINKASTAGILEHFSETF